MLTITFKLFTSHAPTAVPVPSHERRHICYSLNFYDDGARHGFPLTRRPLPPSDWGLHCTTTTTITRTRWRTCHVTPSEATVCSTLTTSIYEFHLKFTLTFIKATKWMRRYSYSSCDSSQLSSRYCPFRTYRFKALSARRHSWPFNVKLAANSDFVLCRISHAFHGPSKL